MEILNYKGKNYKRINGYWYDSSNMKVAKAMQTDLNSEYSNQIDTENMTVNELLQLADDYKNANVCVKAANIYEQILDELDVNDIKYIASRLTSCYRSMSEPEKAIEFYNDIYNKYHNDIISPALLTSMAGAYMDIDDYNMAKKMADRAYAMSGGHADGELMVVYQRLKSNI